MNRVVTYTNRRSEALSHRISLFVVGRCKFNSIHNPLQKNFQVTLKSGEKRKLWCTFGPEQIDINPFSEPGRVSTELCRV